VGGRGCDPQRVGLLALVSELGESLLGSFCQAQRAIGVAFLESDARSQDVDDRANANVAGEGRALAAPVDRFASRGHISKSSSARW
jgi:hypothetical protein